MNFSIIRKQLSIVLFFLCFFIKTIYAQSTANNYSLIDNLQPVTPTMWQFTKYTNLPVSEYTGIPNVSVPIYTIDEDGLKIPISLTYNSSGIKVNEDASWVGLGWDMTFGSIIQQINDQDDFENGVTHLQSDFLNTGTPIMYPYKYQFCYNGSNPPCNSPCQSTIPVTTPSISNGMVTYTWQYAPFNGSYNQQDYLHYFDDHVYNKVDSEPDVFSANFFGHSFKFIMQWNPEQYIVLDKKGYNISRSGNTWTVFVPSGEEYIFNELTAIQTISSSLGITNQISPDPELPTSNVWMLTQIITKNKKIITFNYTQTATKPCFPQFSQKGIKAVLATSGFSGDPSTFCSSINVGSSTIGSNTLSTISYSYEPHTYLSSITFPKGTITFNLSSRTDIAGGLKLDSLAIASNQTVKLWKFNYTYLNSSGVGGNGFTYDTVGLSSTQLYRLQLLTLKDNTGAKYTFTYNSTPLPAKNSFATDYWGYYNGDLSNVSFVPNATQFNQTNYQTNSDNHSANLTYAEAGLLTQLQYPTGGSVNFTYALNQFNNYWVPNYSSNTNTVSSGDGLRVQSIVWKDASGNQSKQTNYSYSTGLASIPLNFFREYTFGTVASGPFAGGAPLNFNSYTVYETNPSGSFTANPFASFNGVGYSQVTKTDVDNSGNPNGKTITNYFNTPDLVYNSITTISQIDPTLPAYKSPADTAENGSLKSELIYNNANHLLKKTTNTYVKTTSSTYYGARVMAYGDYVNYISPDSMYPYQQMLYPQSTVGYYPVFDFETLLNSSKETDYFGTDSLSITKTNTYDQYNQLVQVQQDNSDGTASYFGYSYPYSASPSPGTVFANMTAANRLSDIVSANQLKSRVGNSPETINSFNRSYAALGNLFVAAKDSTYNNGAVILPTFTTYDKYDPTNGNIWQYSQNTLPTAVLWDYNKEYVIAIAKNALFTNIAYTSFEADGTGRWKFTGASTPDPVAPTGQKVYSLSNGNIYRDSLNTALTYVISYWSKSGAQTVSGSTATKTGFTFNGYTYYEHTVPTPTSGTITVSGTGTIDELRLYPNTALMTSYTYNPLVGISSEDNAGGKIAYYEYDNALRLLDIRDQYKHILKAYCYNYAGQPTTCGLDISYSSQALSQTFTRNNCLSGYVGSSVTYSVPLGKYTSTMSLQDANNQAQEDMTANGQATANSSGSCALPPTITLIQYAGHGTGLTQVNFTTMPGCTTIAINWKDLGTGVTNNDYGGCTSPRNETLTVGHNYQFTVTCYSTSFPATTSAPYNYTPAD